MKALVYIDGKVLPPNEAKVSVMDRGFLFGDGVYEAGRSYDRCFLFLEEHWNRFRISAEKLYLEIPWSDEELTQSLHETAREYRKPDMCFRSIVTRGAIDVVGLDIKELGKPTLVHVVQDVPAKYESQRQKGILLLTSKIQRNPVSAQDPNIKTSNYLNSLLAFQEVKKRGGEDAILCNANGKVTEGTNFSIFGVSKNGKVITPSLTVGILDSITRRHVLDLARKDFEVEEGEYALEEILACEESFIVSSTREILAVRQWDDRQFTCPGPITKKLHQSLLEEIAEYVKTHTKF